MTGGTRIDSEKASPDAYEQKMGRQRPAFLNQETLDNVAHEHQVYLQRLGEEPQLEERSKASDIDEA